MEKERKNFEKQLEELVEKMSQLIIEKLNSVEDKQIFIHRKNMDYPKLRDYGGEQMQIKSVSLNEDNLVVFFAQHEFHLTETGKFTNDQISIEQLAFLTEIILDPNYDNE